ncbi:MAG TPA: PAS domain S-box protein [Lacunisphaera sp.]
MTLAPSKSGRLTWPAWLRLLGGLLLCGGSVALAGRIFGVNALMTMVPGSSRVPSATALMLLGLGAGLLQAGAGRLKPARVCGWAVTGFAALIILSRLAGDFARPDVLLGRMFTNTGSDQVGATASISLLLGGLIVMSLANAGLKPARLAVLSGGLFGLTLLTVLKHVTGLQMALPGGLQFGLAAPVMVGLLLLAVTGLVGAARHTTGSRGQPATSYTVAAVVMLTCVGLFGLHLNNEQQLATARLVGSYEIVASVNYIELCVTRVELASREFALTRSETWAAYATDMDHRLGAELIHFDRLLFEHDADGPDAVELRRLVLGMRQEMKELIRWSRDAAPGAGVGAARAAARSSQMELLRDRVNAVEFKVRQRQVQDAAAVQANSYETTKIILVGNIVAGLLGFVALAQMLRSERKLSAAERELLGVNRLQQAVLDGGVFSVIATEPNGTITLFSRGAENMLGYRREEMIGQRTPVVIHVSGELVARSAELGAQFGRWVEPGFETLVARARLGEADEREWTYVRKDGVRLPVLLSVTALRNEAGAITGFLGIAQDLTERKKAEVALQASEERLGKVLGHAECLVWEARVTLEAEDWDWHMSVYPSGLFQRLTGDTVWKPGAGLWYKFEIPEQAEMDRRSREAMERGQPGYTQEFRLVREGQTTWVRETVAIRPQGDGRYWLVGVAIDVTDRKVMEETLRVTEERFRSFAQLAPVGICQTDHKGRCLYMNDRWCEITGRSAAEALGENWAIAVHPEDRRQVLAAWAALARGLPESLVECRFVHADGRVRWVAGSAIPLRDGRGQITGFLGTVTDITAAKEAKVALEQSEERFRSAFDYAGIGMALVGLDGRWLRINRVIHHMLGYPEAELLQRTSQEVTHPEDVNADLANVADLVAGRRRHYQMEKRYLHRDGSIVHARLTVTCVRDAAGEPLHFIAQIEDITARYQAEQAVVASQRQLSDIFRSMAEGLVLQDAQGRIIECNAAAENILGLSRAQLLGLTSTDARWQALNEDGTPCPSDQHPAAMTRMTGQPCRGVVLGVSKTDSTRRWISVNTEAILDDNGYLKAVVASFSDITDRKQAEEALRQSQQLFRRLFESSPDAIVLVDHNGRIVRTNVRAETLFGWPAGTLTGQALQVLLHPHLRERHDKHLLKYFENPHARAMGAGLELAGMRKDGSSFPVDIMLSPLETQEGRQTLAVVRDITSRRQMERALREGEERMRLFAEHAPASVAMFDREMRYLVHSTKWLKDYGLDGQAIIGRSHYEVFPEISENWKEIHRRCLAGATEINESDPFERADGSRQWLSWRVQPWRNAAGEIGGIVMFTEDITRRKELENSLAAARDQALAASKMKSEFLANVSHEIRTPMNGVLGMADLLMDTRLTEDQRQMGRVIQASAQSLLKLIDDLLDFSKIEAGKFSITTDVFSLTEQVDQALALMAPRAVSSQVSLESDLPADLPARLWGDAGRIQQVLVNLLGNAVKFTEKGCVIVSVRPLTPTSPGHYAFRIEVRDTGIGISEEQQARLFQPFMQADGSTTRRFGGTGLGLAISRQLIELMGGRIGCRSEVGQGSVFWVELELPLAAEPPAVRKAASPAAVSAGGAKILVAEDQQANQLVMRLLLTKLGLDHTIVGDGQAAIEKLGTGDYALVLMDCQMPRIDGYEATRLIRAGAAGPDRQATPIVALTAHAMASDREKCFEAGMDDYLSKPIRLEALQAILQRLGIHFVPAAAEPAPAPAVSAVVPVLDPAQLAQLRSLPGRTQPSLLEELAGMALQEMPATLAQLHHHIKQQAATDATQTAHRLAGAAANLGATALRAMLLEIEQAADKGDWPKVQRRLADLDRTWALVQQALGDLLPKPPHENTDR